MSPTPPMVHRRDVLRRTAVGLVAALFATEVTARGDEPTAGTWDGSTVEEIASLKVQGNRCLSAVFSRDGRQLAAVGFLEGGRPFASWVTVWDTATWKPRTTIKIDDLRAHRLIFTPDGSKLIVGGLDAIRVVGCEVESGKVFEIHKNPEQGGLLSQFQFTPDGNQLFLAGPDGVLVWETDTWVRSRDVYGARDQSYQLAAAPAGPDWIVFGGWLYGMNMYGVVSVLINPMPLQRSGAFPDWRFNRVRGVDRPWLAGGLAIFPNGKRAAISAVEEDGRAGITVYEIEEPTVWRKKFEIPVGRDGTSVYALSVSPDGRMVLAGGSDKRIRCWDASDGKELAAIAGHNGAVMSLSWSLDRSNLVSTGGADPTAKVWARKKAK